MAESIPLKYFVEATIYCHICKRTTTFDLHRTGPGARFEVDKVSSGY